MAVNPVGGGYLNSVSVRASYDVVYALPWDQGTRTMLFPFFLIDPFSLGFRENLALFVRNRYQGVADGNILVRARTCCMCARVLVFGALMSLMGLFLKTLGTIGSLNSTFAKLSFVISIISKS